jgi:hypothetical protein
MVDNVVILVFKFNDTLLDEVIFSNPDKSVIIYSSVGKTSGSVVSN